MRHGRSLAISAIALCALAPVTAFAQAERSIGPSVGVFFPNDSTLRDKLGSSWLSIGASGVAIDPFQKQRAYGFDWNAFSKDKDGNRVFMVAGSLGLTMTFGQPGAMTHPYAAIRGGLSYIDYAVDMSNVNRVSGKKIGFNANAEVGVNVGHNFNVSARYDLFPSYEGLRFSGLSLALKWGVVRY